MADEWRSSPLPPDKDLSENDKNLRKRALDPAFPKEVFMTKADFPKFCIDVGLFQPPTPSEVASNQLSLARGMVEALKYPGDKVVVCTAKLPIGVMRNINDLLNDTMYISKKRRDNLLLTSAEAMKI